MRSRAERRPRLIKRDSGFGRPHPVEAPLHGWEALPDEHVVLQHGDPCGAPNANFVVAGTGRLVQGEEIARQENVRNLARSARQNTGAIGPTFDHQMQTRGSSDLNREGLMRVEGKQPDDGFHHRVLFQFVAGPAGGCPGEKQLAGGLDLPRWKGRQPGGRWWHILVEMPWASQAESLHHHSALAM
jgi:hypothetical protein